jgi:hypothetical protein
MEVCWFSLMADVIFGEMQIDATAVALMVIAGILGLLFVKKTSEVRALESLQETLAQLAARPLPEASQSAAAVETPLPAAAPMAVAAPPSVAKIPPQAVPSEEADPRLLAVLMAAAATVVGRPVVVRRITIINRGTVSGWAEAGRTSIHLSHNPRWN